MTRYSRPVKKTRSDIAFNFIDWIFNHFWLVVIVVIAFGIGATLWAYDGDVKCLVAECRILKEDDR